DVQRWHGLVRVPMNSESDRFDLVIDSAKREIYVDLVRTGPMSYWRVDEPDHIEGNAGTRTLERLSFDEIDFMDQKTGSAFGNNAFLERDASALRFNKKYVAPAWDGIVFVHCIMGGVAQRRATRNLGLMVQRAVGLPDAKVKLERPV